MTIRTAAIAALLGATAIASAGEPAAVDLGPDLEVRELRPGYWVHVSKDGHAADNIVVWLPDGPLGGPGAVTPTLELLQARAATR